MPWFISRLILTVLLLGWAWVHNGYVLFKADNRATAEITATGERAWGDEIAKIARPLARRAQGGLAFFVLGLLAIVWTC